MTSLSEEEEQAITAKFPIKTYKKDKHLLKEGQIAKNAYQVIKGCIRAYEISPEEERTTAFYTEGDAAANFQSLSTNSPSSYYLTCTEETTVAVLNAEKEQELYKQFPRFESFCRTGMEQMMGNKQTQLTDLILLKPEQRYLKLKEERSDLLQRVPQYLIASYLAIKPETLSRIRKKLAEKK